MEKVKAFFETVISDPDPKKHGKAKKILLEGTWDGEKFISYKRYGSVSETIVRKKEWILFEKPKKL